MAPDVISILLEQQRQTLAQIDEIRSDVNEIKLSLAEKRGERRMGMYLITTLGGVVGAIITTLFRYVGMHR